MGWRGGHFSVGITIFPPSRVQERKTGSTSKRINITMPEETLRRVDAAAKRPGLSRYSYLTRAAQEVMEQEDCNSTA